MHTRFLCPFAFALAACSTSVGADGPALLDSGFPETRDPDAAVAPVDAEPGIETSKQRIRYVVIPHPDDEFGSWALISRSTLDYPVFILLTRGEQTGYCDAANDGLEEAEGEIAPTPTPQGRWSAECAAARVASWHAFLDEQPTLDGALDSLGDMTYRGVVESRVPSGAVSPQRDDDGATRPSTAFEMWVGPRSARVVFDLGDGDLTRAEVTWAVATVRDWRSELLPLSEEGDVVGASFYNASYPDCVTYTHPDHRAVHESLWFDDLGAGTQWGRTCETDPDATRVDAIDPDVFSANVHVQADGTRVGHIQRIYGWLTVGSWDYGERDGDALAWTRVQAHWGRSFR